MEHKKSTVENMVNNNNFWQGKKVLVTGHTGFKGSWLIIWLNHLGAFVKGYSLEPNTSPSLFESAKIQNLCTHQIGDIREFQETKKAILEFSPEIVFHLAAQPLVRYSYSYPLETFETNIMGTANVLEAIRGVKSVRAVVAVTTDKCYQNNEWHWGYREDDKLGGHDPYSASKAGAELIIGSMRSSYFQSSTSKTMIASARAGNVIGGGDWAADRLIPDVIRSFEAKVPVQIRSPLSIRPWQHVLESLNGYMILAEKLSLKGKPFAEAWNFGPHDSDAKNVKYITESLSKKWGTDAEVIISTEEHPHEATYLKLDNSKARTLLCWQPRWNLDQALERTAGWYKKFYRREASSLELCLADIKEYMKKE